jgi:hypothetical protein
MAELVDCCTQDVWNGTRATFLPRVAVVIFDVPGVLAAAERKICSGLGDGVCRRGGVGAVDQDVPETNVTVLGRTL